MDVIQGRLKDTKRHDQADHEAFKIRLIGIVMSSLADGELEA
jgi:hypothetical protein